MTTEEKFHAAVNVIRGLPKDGPYHPSHDMMLKFYGLYKQATEGECQDPKPAFYEVVKGYKWRAWKGLGTMTKLEAMSSYVEELKKIVETMSYSEDVASFMDALGPFYEYVDILGFKKDENEITNNNIINKLKQGKGSDENGFDHEDNMTNGFSAIPNLHELDVPSGNEQESVSGYPEDDVTSDSTLEQFSAVSAIYDEDETEVISELPASAKTLKSVKNAKLKPYRRLISDTESDEEYGEPVENPDLLQYMTLENGLDNSPKYINGILSINGDYDENAVSANIKRAGVPGLSYGGSTGIHNTVVPGGAAYSVPGGSSINLPPVNVRQNGLRSNKSSSRNSLSGGGSPGHGGGGGMGGRPNGNGREPNRHTPSDINQQLLVVLQQIQSDMNSIMTRLANIEATSASPLQCSHCVCQTPVEKSWWPFPELSPRSTFFLLAWPIILHGGIKLLLLLRSRRTKRSS